MIVNFEEIMARARKQEKKRLILAPALDSQVIEILSDAVKSDLIAPVFVGDGEVIEELLRGSPVSSRNYEIIDESDHQKSISRAIGMIKDNKGDFLMQGVTDSQLFVDAVLDRDTGLLTDNLASFVSVFEMQTENRMMMITDTYINNFPTLAEKKVIVENAVQLTDVLGIKTPKIAALSAIEQINPAIPSTLDAAVLSKMSERKQFSEVIIDGPLDVDCAVSRKAAARKGISSPVAGDVDIYLTPDIEAGYLLSQLLIFIGKMPMAGVMMGTANPVILDLPFVSTGNKLIEIAIAVLLCNKSK
jgi:phosphate butyryltransferase